MKRLFLIWVCVFYGCIENTKKTSKETTGFIENEILRNKSNTVFLSFYPNCSEDVGEYLVKEEIENGKLLRGDGYVFYRFHLYEKSDQTEDYELIQEFDKPYIELRYRNEHDRNYWENPSTYSLSGFVSSSMKDILGLYYTKYPNVTPSLKYMDDEIRYRKEGRRVPFKRLIKRDMSDEELKKFEESRKQSQVEENYFRGNTFVFTNNNDVITIDGGLSFERENETKSTIHFEEISIKYYTKSSYRDYERSLKSVEMRELMKKEKELNELEQRSKRTLDDI